MTTIRQFMTADHRHCDDRFAQVEEAVGRRDLVLARSSFAGFQTGMLAHFSGEEETLFPAFEQRTGMSEGPTRVMRMEHQQIRGLLQEAAEALAAGDVDGYLGVADTIVIMMQQHNMKEENILYPMCDQHLAGEAPELLEHLQAGLSA